MLVPIKSWEITRMRVASFIRLSESLGTRLVQNGRLYIRYRSSSQKNEAEELKKLRLHPFANLMLNLLYKFC